MKTYPLGKGVILVAAILVACTFAGGCRKKEAQQYGGTGEVIRLDDLSQIENLKEILRKDPNNLQALVNIGNLYFDTNQDLLAIEHYQRALAIDPNNSNVRVDMAVCYRRSGNPDRAIDELKKVISVAPRHAQARYNLGLILLHDKGDVDGGIRAWEALLENVPEYPYRDNLRADIQRMRAMADGKKGAETPKTLEK